MGRIIPYLWVIVDGNTNSKLMKAEKRTAGSVIMFYLILIENSSPIVIRLNMSAHSIKGKRT